MLDYNFDPSAGCSRLRAFLDAYEFWAYEDGTWLIFRNNEQVACGKELTQDLAKKRILKVYKALI